MSYFDFAGATKIVQLLESSTPADGTVEPSYTAGVCSDVAYENEPTCVAAGEDWTAPYFTQSFDARPYIGALIVVDAGAFGANSDVTVTLKKSAEPAFSSWATFDDFEGDTAAFSKIVGGSPGAGEVADNAYYFCRLDLSKTQNAVGIQVVTSLTGVETCKLGVLAVLFPQDTTDADEPQFKV